MQYSDCIAIRINNIYYLIFSLFNSLAEARPAPWTPPSCGLPSFSPPWTGALPAMAAAQLGLPVYEVIYCELLISRRLNTNTCNKNELNRKPDQKLKEIIYTAFSNPQPF